MATKQETQSQPQVDASKDGASGGDTLSVTDNRTGKTYEIEITDGTIRTMDLRQIKVSDDDFGLMGYDPAFTNTASCRSAITYIDGEAGILQHRGIPIEELCEKSTYLEVAYLLIFGELPTKTAARPLGLRRHPPHLRPRGHQEVQRGLPPRRPPDGDAARKRRRALDVLSAGEGHRRPGGALHGGDQTDRQGPHPRRVGLPAQHGAALRLPGQRAELLGELPLDAVQDGEPPASPIRAWRRRWTCSSSSTPTTSRTARPTRSAPSGHRGSIRIRPWRPAWRRSTGPSTAAPTRPVLRMLRRIETTDNIPDFLEG